MGGVMSIETAPATKVKVGTEVQSYLPHPLINFRKSTLALSSQV